MKTDEVKFENSVKFVASHYESGAFRRHDAWVRIFGKKGFNWKRISVAASVICVILAASAFVYMTLDLRDRSGHKEDKNIETVSSPDVKTGINFASLEFIDAPLSEVVEKIETTYGVTISGLPDKELYLTLKYEGTAQDLVETINDALGTDLKIEQSE